MADRRLTPDVVVVTGTTPTALANILISDNHQVRNDGRVMLRCFKANAVDAVFTFDTPGNVGGYAIANPITTVPASGGVQVMGPFPPNLFNDSSGDLRFTVSDVDGLSLEVYNI